MSNKMVAFIVRVNKMAASSSPHGPDYRQVAVGDGVRGLTVMDRMFERR
jgi:hypothetical protein